MNEEIFTWMEEYCGVSYDFQEAVSSIDGRTAFISPFEWRISIEMILEQLNTALDVIDDHKRAIPETMPNATELKRIFTLTTLRQLIANIVSVCAMMNIDPPEITSIDQLNIVVVTIADLITMLSNHNIDEILKQNLFEEYEEANDSAFFNVLQLHRQDMTQLSFAVNEIRQMYYESMDEEDDDFNAI